MPLKADCLGR